MLKCKFPLGVAVFTHGGVVVTDLGATWLRVQPFCLKCPRSPPHSTVVMLNRNPRQGWLRTLVSFWLSALTSFQAPLKLMDGRMFYHSVAPLESCNSSREGSKLGCMYMWHATMDACTRSRWWKHQAGTEEHSTGASRAADITFNTSALCFRSSGSDRSQGVALLQSQKSLFYW